jgi:transcription termination factor Rho
MQITFEVAPEQTATPLRFLAACRRIEQAGSLPISASMALILHGLGTG